MIDFNYLYQGLCGLANAHRAGTMAGHLGAAVVAGYFVGEDQSELPNEVFRGITGELDRIIRGEEAIWFNAKKAGISPSELFEALPLEEANETSIKSIATALQANIAQTRQSGHNVIFASIGLRALHDHPDYATPAMVSGISKLVAGFNGAHAGRGYYGRETGWLTGNQVKLTDQDRFPAYAGIQQMVEATVSEVIENAAVRKQGFGGLWHLINHAAALTELNRLGYRKLAEQGLPAHHQHACLWRSLPNVEEELGTVSRAEHDPRTAAYWKGMLQRDEARLTHRIKTLYGFYTLLPLVVDEAKQKQAEQSLLYLMS